MRGVNSALRDAVVGHCQLLHLIAMLGISFGNPSKTRNREVLQVATATWLHARIHECRAFTFRNKDWLGVAADRRLVEICFCKLHLRRILSGSAFTRRFSTNRRSSRQANHATRHKCEIDQNSCRQSIKARTAIGHLCVVVCTVLTLRRLGETKSNK